MQFEPYNEKMSDSDEGTGVPLIEQLSSSELDSPPSSSRKRKLEESTSKRASKRKKSKKKYNDDDGTVDIAVGINTAFAHMDSRLLADYIAQRTKQFETELSAVELGDKFIPGMEDEQIDAIKKVMINFFFFIFREMDPRHHRMANASNCG